MENIQKAGIYVRQSQTHEATVSPQLQEKYAREFAQAQGWEVVEVFSDIDISGRKMDNRPGLKKLRAGYDAGQFQIAVAYDLSRFSRTMTDGASIISDMRVATYVEGIAEKGDDFTPLLFLLLAHKQSRDIGKRWKEVRTNRIEKGLPATGAQYVGYTKVDGIHAPNDDAPRIVKAYESFLKGRTFREIAEEWNDSGMKPKKTDKWNARMVRDTLNLKFYVGTIQWDKEEFTGVHEPLISEELWSAYQVRRSEFAGRGTKNKTEWYLSGIMTCKWCGSGIGITGKSPNGVRIGCTRRHVHGKTVCPDSRSVYAKAADSAFVAFIAGNEEKTNAAMPNPESEELTQAVLEAEFGLKKAEEDLSKFVEISTDLGLSLSEMKETLGRRRKAVESAKDTLTQVQAQKGLLDAVGDQQDALITGGEGMSVSEWNAILRGIIKEAFIDDDGSVIIR